MANFGLSGLTVAAPHLPTWRETSETSATAGSGEPVWLMERARAAVGAVDIIKSAKICDTVASAAADCDLLLGASALQRRTPDRDVVLLPGAREYLAGRLPAGKKHTAGILFGSERSGLTNEDLSYCHAVLNIPACEKQPSINLGQAVALVCYELAGRRTGAVPRAVRPIWQVPSIREIEKVAIEICALVDETEGLDRTGESYKAEIRRGLLDARLRKGAMVLLTKLLCNARKNK
jgi:tRNA/rRNA methyltransferase